MVISQADCINANTIDLKTISGLIGRDGDFGAFSVVVAIDFAINVGNAFIRSDGKETFHGFSILPIHFFGGIHIYCHLITIVVECSIY